jgi:hypothetical protein
MNFRPLVSPREVRWAFAVAVVLALPSALTAEEGILVLHAEDTKGIPVSGVVLAPKGDGAAGPPASDSPPPHGRDNG